MIVEIVRRGAGRKYPASELKLIVVKLLAALKKNKSELSIALVGDKEMRPLNAKYRRNNKTTDVLAFPSDEKHPAGSVLLGDVVISVEQARRQAKERKKTVKSEMVTLLIHGILHLLGYDHERSERQAKVMRSLEQKLYGFLCDEGLLKV
jgi:probable rRNA maturation factor